MASIKCAQCGLVNFSHAENCKRCRATLHPTLNATVNREEDASTPVPVVGAWRDGRRLVKQISVPLMQRCIKCSESADITYKPVSLRVDSAWSLLTLLAGVRIVHVIPVDVPLCRRHRHVVDKVASAICVVGIVGCVVGFALMQMSSILPVVIFVSGFLVIALGILVYLARQDPVKLSRFKDPYVWLWGVDGSYLEALPEWSERHAR